MSATTGLGYTKVAGSLDPPPGGWVAPSGSNAEWWREDVIVMVDAAESKLAAAGEGHKLRSKDSDDVAEKCNKKLRGGARKTGKSVMRKISEVLKIYTAVEFLMGLDGKGSGLGWHPTFGANICTPEQELVWKGIVAKHPYCKPFRNKSWDLSDVVGRLKPSKAKGDYVIRAASGRMGANRPPSPPPPATTVDDSVSTPRQGTPVDDDFLLEPGERAVSQEDTPAPAPTTPAPVSRKRFSTSTASSTPGPSKRSRTADGLAAISATFSEFTAAYKESAAMFASVLQPPDHSKAALHLVTEKDRAWLKKHGKWRQATKLLKNGDDARHYLNMAELGSSPRKDTLRGELNISDTEDDDE
ncbi:hypothetical protein EXIGLDRAFT_778339 [Exidia glandulosa HHB12029]|uniref:Myb/SANT-like domain-containing protein n=1 Tax=Exidia glandulosa HHB12029 TaxID=1314781 RepID=A0A165CKE8_EXIGL|nr:hypothetical protein EXIGLDRAFT_778339 [Exidia glandulosa HHB12029]